MYRICLILLMFAWLLSACGGSESDDDQKKKMVLEKKTSLPTTVDGSPFVVKQLPPMVQRVDANLEKKAILLGYSINTDTYAPGQVLNITWYWKSIAQITGTWEYFTHLIDSDGALVQSVNSQGAMRSKYKPQMWKPGEIIKDVESIVIPKTWTSPVLELRTGLWYGPQRMNVVSGPVDAENRIKGPVVTISAETPKPVFANSTTTEIPYSTKAPKLDGKLDEKVWESAKQLDRFKNTLTGGMVKYPTDVKLFWDSRNLYIGMRAIDTELVSLVAEHDLPLWSADAFDLFIRPNDTEIYFEIQISPNGIIYDASYATYRKADTSWESQVKVAVAVDGDVNRGTEADSGWTAELAIPLSSIRAEEGGALVEGVPFFANFFRIDKNVQATEYSGWSPPMRGDFHAQDRMGQILLKK